MAADGRIAIADLPVVQMQHRIASGALKAIDLAEAVLARIAEREPQIGAFAWLDPDYVRGQAKALDAWRASGRPIGPLHGLPVALKDVIDTKGIPTENGTAIDAGRVPDRDAAVVQRLKAAGAVILGKTVTTELAFLTPAGTRNPHDPSRTPGGSSSGSAAAVAAGMAPLALGTQTAGSVIRPASFCGVTGFKPTFGAIPRTGVLRQAQSLDTIGIFAPRPEDAALLADALFGDDPGDPATAPATPPRLFTTATAAPPVAPVFAFVRPPGWDQADPDLQAGLAELAGALGEAQVFDCPLPRLFDEADAIRKRIQTAELARSYLSYTRRGAAHLSPALREAIAEGTACSAPDYIAALEWADVLNSALAQIFERCDAILTPAALGPAPAGLEATGDPIFNGLWTLARVPALTLPILTSGAGLPMGVQLIGPRGGDGRLLRTGRWLMDWADVAAGRMS